MFGQLVDRIAAMQQNAFVAIDEGDLRFARTGGGEAGVKGEVTGLGIKRADVDHFRSQSTGNQREFIRTAIGVVGECYRFLLCHLTVSL